MKRALAVVAVAAVAMLLGFPVAAMAGSPIDEAVPVIEQSRVYVAPGVNASADAIRARLNDTDGIVVAMFPADVAMTADDIASQINSRLGSRLVVMVAVGGETAVSTTVVPEADAGKALSYAESVSTSPAETLMTFADNIHQYQKAHPEAKVTEPVASKSSGTKTDASSIGTVFIVVGVLLIVSGGVIAGVGYARRLGEKREQELKLRSPDKVKVLLKQVLEKRSQINDLQLRRTLIQMATDVEALFAKARRTETKARVEELEQSFQLHLASLKSVVDQYIEIQDDMRYYEDPGALLAQGVSAVNGFAEFALDSARRIGKEALTNYRVDTDILDAQRYR